MEGEGGGEKGRREKSRNRDSSRPSAQDPWLRCHVVPELVHVCVCVSSQTFFQPQLNPTHPRAVLRPSFIHLPSTALHHPPHSPDWPTTRIENLPISVIDTRINTPKHNNDPVHFQTADNSAHTLSPFTAHAPVPASISPKQGSGRYICTYPSHRHISSPTQYPPA